MKQKTYTSFAFLNINILACYIFSINVPKSAHKECKKKSLDNDSFCYNFPVHHKMLMEKHISKPNLNIVSFNSCCPSMIENVWFCVIFFSKWRFRWIYIVGDPVNPKNYVYKSPWVLWSVSHCVFLNITPKNTVTENLN